MFKSLFSNRLFVGALAFFVLCVGGSLLYMQHVKRQSARELAETEERIKTLTEKQNPHPPAEASIVEKPEQGEHLHEDGTFHTEPHVMPQPSTERNTPQVSRPRHPGVSDVVPRRLPEDVFSAEYTAQVKAAVQTCVSLFHASEAEQKAGGMDEAFGQLIDARNDALRLSKLAYRTNNLSYQARADEIHALREPFDTLTASIPRPKLNAEQLAQIEKAAEEFESITQQLGPAEQQRLRDLGIENPYRTRLEEEKNR